MTVKYNPVGDNLPTVLSTAVQGGNPPDIAAIAQVGLLSQFAKAGKLKTLDSVKDDVVANFGQSVVDTGHRRRQVLRPGLEGANKSTVWYNVKSFTDAGVDPPRRGTS